MVKWEAVNSADAGPDVGGLETFPNEWKLFARRGDRTEAEGLPRSFLPRAYPKEATGNKLSAG